MLRLMSYTNLPLPQHILNILGENRPFQSVIYRIDNLLEDLAVGSHEEGGPALRRTNPGFLRSLVSTHHRILHSVFVDTTLNSGIVVEEIDPNYLQPPPGIILVQLCHDCPGPIAVFGGEEVDDERFAGE